MAEPDAPEPAGTATAEPPSSTTTKPVPAPSNEPIEPASDDAAALRREAAGYRRRLRDVEAERDQLREGVDRRDRVDAERLAGERMAAPGDLWLAAQLDDLRGEDGELSPELVNAAIDKVLEHRPHWRKLGQGFDGGVRTSLPDEPLSFGEALKQAGQP